MQAHQGGLISLLGSGTVLPPSLFHAQSSTEIPTVVVDIKSISREASSSSSSSATPATATISKDVVLLVDISGSMSQAIPIVKETILQVADSLNEQDRLAMVTFGDRSNIMFDFMVPTGNNLDVIKKNVASLAVNGMTNMHAGIMDVRKVIQNSNNDGSRLVMCLLLSDGSPNVGISKESELVDATKKAVAELSNLPVIPQFVVHSLGFTDSHSASLLTSLTTTGNGGNGMYYFLKTQADIKAAVADCLGSTSKLNLYALRISASPLRGDNEPVPGWRCAFYDGNFPAQASESALPPGLFHIGYLSENERRNVVVLAQPLSAEKKGANYDFPASILIQAYYNDPIAHRECVESFVCPVLQGGSSNPDLIAQALHVQTHVLRLRVADALHSLAANTRASTEAHEQLHELLLQTVASVQEAAANSTLISLAEDESLLFSLEKDLGEALERAHQALSAQDRITMKHHAHEHANQRSASTTTELRATYTTPEQAAMRAKFGCATNDEALKILEAAAKDDKLKVELIEAHLSPEQIEKRKSADEDVACFVTLDNWRAAHIGIGILVKPRTMRERFRRLIPTLELVNDYISATAYNQGVRSKVGGVGVQDRDKAGDQHSVLPSSSRGRINAWLPLYINATNWNYVKAWAPSAFSIIATQVNDKFQPIYAVQVCARLLNHSVVKFMSGDIHLSDKALQQYADVHRLCLEMVADYPTIRQAASKALEDFVAKPWVRGREMTPDIGDLIQYLTVTDTLTWEGFKEAYIQESFRRNARWVDSRVPGGESRNIGPHSSDEELVAYWSEGTQVSTKLMLFNVMFLNLVARPEGKSLDDVKNSYDLNWGRLSDTLIAQLKNGAAEIANMKTLNSVMAKIGIPDDDKSIADQIRWAYSNKQEVPIPTELKKADATTDTVAQYSQYVQNRNIASTVSNTITKVANDVQQRTTTLYQFFTDRFTAAGHTGGVKASLHLKDIWAQPGLPPLDDMYLQFLKDNNVDAELILMPSGTMGHSVFSRATAAGVDTRYVIKEMVFGTDSGTVMCIANGTADVATYALSKGHVSLSISANNIAAAAGFNYASGSVFAGLFNPNNTTNATTTNNNNNASSSSSSNTTNDAAKDAAIKKATTLHQTFLAQRVLDLGDDAVIYMSAGCRNFLLSMRVGELRRLLPDATVVKA